MRVLISAAELEAEVARIGAEVSSSYADGVVLVGILKGSIPFMADLARSISIQAEVDFLALSAYSSGGGRVRIAKDLETDIHGRDVLVVEDIIDTGLTLSYVINELLLRGPRSLSVCTLLDRSGRRLVPTPIQWAGFEIHDDFALGYGLDYLGRYRNLDHIVAADLAVLMTDPDAYLTVLYDN